MIEKVVKATLVAIRQSTYTMYVFKLDNDEYIMCTRLPNWQTPDISEGDEGFLQYQIVKAGETYYDPDTGETIKYKYSNIYFKNFVLLSEDVNKNSIIV